MEKAEAIGRQKMGLAAGVWGLGVVIFGFGVYVLAGEPFARGAILSAPTTITGQRTDLGSWPQSQFVSPISRHYFDSYSFTDEAGRLRMGEDEVSVPFYLQHPPGSKDVVYFHPGGQGSPAIGTPLAIDGWQRVLDRRLASVLLPLAVIVIAWPIIQGWVSPSGFRRLRGVRR